MSPRLIRVFFFIVTITYLALCIYSQGSPLLFVLKPCIVGTLIALVAFYYFNIRTAKYLLVGALSFSLVGDILLMIPGDKFTLFLAGLFSFLLAHICYIILFTTGLRLKSLNKQMILLSMIVLLVYSFVLLDYLIPTLDDLFFPVLMYVLIILTMTFVAINRYGQVSNRSHLLVMTGAIFFVISDSLLAIDKFYTPLAYSAFWIMATYSCAQYLIVTGILEDSNKMLK